MDDKELVEVWQSEFEAWYKSEFKKVSIRKYKGNYYYAHALFKWNAWLAAKRSQPSVVLPEQNPMIFGLVGYEANDLHDRLTAAGIKYTIGE